MVTSPSSDLASRTLSSLDTGAGTAAAKEMTRAARPRVALKNFMLIKEKETEDF